MNNVRTVSDTKRAFYTIHTRPINSLYRRVVEELMVEMHLLSVNADFRHDSIYSLGVVTTFDRFMQGYRPERDKDSIFNAICRSVEGDPQNYYQQVERLKAEASQYSVQDLLSQLKQPDAPAEGFVGELKAIAQNPQFKYSRLFAIGLYSLIETMNPDLVANDEKRHETLKDFSETLNLSTEKVQKDLDFYRSNLEKMAQAQAVMDDILKADRKKKEERAKNKGTVTTSSSGSEETPAE